MESCDNSCGVMQILLYDVEMLADVWQRFGLDKNCSCCNYVL